MKPRKGDVPAGTDHAEGAHGDKTHEAYIERLQSGKESDVEPGGSSEVDVFGRPKPGRHRLDEDREQHDLAERNSEHTKLDERDERDR